MTLEAENSALRAENAALRAEIEALTAQLTILHDQVAQLSSAFNAAQAHIAELEAKKTSPPAFVKANAPERPKKPRKKRAPEQNHARRLETPTQIIEHRLECCPACQGRLSGVHLARRRQVVDLPPPPPEEIEAIPAIMRMRSVGSLLHRVARYWQGLSSQEAVLTRISYLFWREDWLQANQDELLRHARNWLAAI